MSEITRVGVDVAAGAAMPSFSRFGNADGFWLQTQRLRAKAA
jgi:hypothetical protein